MKGVPKELLIVSLLNIHVELEKEKKKKKKKKACIDVSNTYTIMCT